MSSQGYDWHELLKVQTKTAVHRNIMADVFLLSPEGSEGLIENNESDDGFGAGDTGFPEGNIAGTATPNPPATRVDGFQL